MSMPLRRGALSRTGGATLAVTLVLAGAAALRWSPSASAAETYLMPSSGSITVPGHGNGHGHGLSQYGARGAAIAGLDAARIIAFYYPGTARVTLSLPATIRTLISGTGSATVVAPAAGLTVTGYGGALPSAGVSRFRLVAPSGVSTLRLDKLVGSTWSTVKAGLPNNAEFSRAANNVRLYLTDGSSTVYRGVIRAVRGGTGVLSINRAGLDQYAEGVVPREMPASWPAAAVQAQAIAARSYGRNAVENNPGRPYDICDTTQCQVYGGMTRYDKAGNVVWSDYPAAVSGNSNVVQQYGGRTIFAQFSASNGGWSVDGGQPYLVAKQDPYDNAGTGDPYLNWTREVSVSSIASSYGLRRLTDIVITQRDGNGQWGGRVLAGYVDGVDGSGTSRRVSTTGFGLQDAMGLPHNWFTIVRPSALPTGHVDRVTAVQPGVVEADGWSFDPDHKDRPGLVALKVDGVLGTMQSTNIARPDVQRIYGLQTAQVGFSIRATVAAGNHTVCVYGRDLDGAATVELGCVALTMPDPVGHLDRVAVVAPGVLQADGWSFDPDHTDRPGLVGLKVDGAVGADQTTSVARPDVQRVYGLQTAQVGFAIQVTVRVGSHTVCPYARDQDGPATVQITCQTVMMPDPFGRVDLAAAGTNSVRLAGWSLDPDHKSSPALVQIVLDGTAQAVRATNIPRPDVQRAYGTTTDLLGYDMTVPASIGDHRACVLGVDRDGQGSVPLRCVTLTVA
jgi:peptidoglycan hydrolase-like amidase